MKCNGEKKGKASRRSYARQYPDQSSHQDTAKTIEEINGLDSNRETENKILKCFHEIKNLISLKVFEPSREY
jgi:hypothetical protein